MPKTKHGVQQGHHKGGHAHVSKQQQKWESKHGVEEARALQFLQKGPVKTEIKEQEEASAIAFAEGFISVSRAINKGEVPKREDIAKMAIGLLGALEAGQGATSSAHERTSGPKI